VQAYFSTSGNTAVPGVAGTADDADIYLWDGTSFTRVLDATAVGLPVGANVDGVKVVGSQFYLSFSNDAGVAVPGVVGTVQDEDIVVYDSGTSTWSLFFDGSAVGVSTNDEDVDAFDILADGSVLISPVVAVGMPGLAGTWADEDLLRCVPTSSAPIASCTWSVYFDGSDVALIDGSEDVDSVSIASNGDIRLSTLGAFSATSGANSLAGNGNQVFACTSPTTGTATACAGFSNVLSLPAGTPATDAITIATAAAPPAGTADLSISKTDGVTDVTAGSPVSYTIVASNAGPDPAMGATVTDTLPATLSGVSWTCSAAGGATCAASGSGNLGTTVDLPVGGTATFTVSGTLSAAATGTLINTATVATPAGVMHPNSAGARPTTRSDAWRGLRRRDMAWRCHAAAGCLHHPAGMWT
jgi:uncharacterized repeat protein (TIGR01451 family)